MKTKIKKSIKYVGMIMSAALIIAATFSSCKKDKKVEPEPDPVPVITSCTSAKFSIITTTGAWPSYTSYLQALSDLTASSLGNSNASEIPASANIWKFDGSIYSNSFGAPATITKYTLDNNCKPVLFKKMVVPGANTFSSIEFISATKAYASVGGGLARIVIFDPSTMQITGEVNLSSIQKAGSPRMYYVGSATNGNNLFLAAYYETSGFDPSYDSCFVAVIDMTTNKVSKLISDGRTGMILGNGPLANVMAKDANGDIYIQGMGYVFGAGSIPSGILRIKNGQSDFDPTYFLNLKTATGENCYSINIFNGKAFTWKVVDPSDFWGYNGANFKLYKLDLAAMSSLGEVSSSIPKAFASTTAPMKLLETNKVYFGVAGDTENALWLYDLSTGIASKKMTLVGQCNGIAKLE